jgi:hypothetical protein
MKEQLVELVEAYAAARVTGNAVLQRFATSSLQGFLSQVKLQLLSAPEAVAETGHEASGSSALEGVPQACSTDVAAAVDTEVAAA